MAASSATSSNSAFASVSAPDHMIVSPEYCILLEKVQCISDSMWMMNGAVIAGTDGFEAVKLLGVCKSHPAFPIFATALSTMPSLANGISIRLWSAKKDTKSKGTPVVMPCFNGNYSQTRTFDCVCLLDGCGCDFYSYGTYVIALGCGREFGSYGTSVIAPLINTQ